MGNHRRDRRLPELPKVAARTPRSKRPRCCPDRTSTTSLVDWSCGLAFRNIDWGYPEPASTLQGWNPDYPAAPRWRGNLASRWHSLEKCVEPGFNEHYHRADELRSPNQGNRP